MYEYKAFVTRVIDGDTVYAKVDLGFDIYIEKLFRLNGIDCPETRSTNIEEKQKGIAAKEFTREQIEKKEVIVLTRKTEKYGRYLADIYIDGRHLNREIAEQGHAKEYHGEKRR